MILSKQSWHYRLYKVMYGEYNRDPTNLCSYFWKVMTGAIFLIPLVIMAIPLWIGERIFGRLEYVGGDGLFSKYSLLAFLVNFCMLLVICMVIFIMFLFGIRVHEGAAMIGVIGWMFLLIILGMYLHSERQDRKSMGVEKEKKPSIFKEIIKAWYGKYCPKISWEEEHRTDSLGEH